MVDSREESAVTEPEDRYSVPSRLLSYSDSLISLSPQKHNDRTITTVLALFARTRLPDRMTDTMLSSWEDLESLPGFEFYRLYKAPSAALAIFRKALSGLAKSFVMALLYMPKPLPLKQLELFVSESSDKERVHALELLHRYHIFKDIKLKSGLAFTLTPEFAKSLRNALTGESGGYPFGKVVYVPTTEMIPIADLDDYAHRRWEGILGYMVGSSAILLEEHEQSETPAAQVVSLLRSGHLIELSGSASRGQRATITKEGFAFVLQDINTQIWTLLFLYVHGCEDDLKIPKVEALTLIFLISSLELGLAYSIDSLSEHQQDVMWTLEPFGIVYVPRDSAGEPGPHFYPTRLATTLTSDSDTTISSTNATLGSSLSSHSSTSKGFIIVETNYRVYAYTSSPLQIALLSLFVNLVSRHPNLVTGKMSKISVQRAVHSGITAEQIISYLTSHAHPQMRRHAQAEQARLQQRNADQGRVVPILPATILDQIHLWQLERDRMTTTEGYLIQDFKNQQEYENPCKYADELGVLVWKDDKKRMFFISKIDAVKEYLKASR